MKSLTRTVLLLALVATTFIPLLHSPLDHTHDNTCNVYVLEELFITDIPSLVIELSTAMVGFIYIVTLTYRTSTDLIISFAVRAPPNQLI